MWQLPDVTRLFQYAVLALVLQGVAWFGASDTVTVRYQLLWVVLAAGGLGVAGVGSTLWLLAGLRALRDRKQHVLGPVLALVPRGADEPSVRPADEALVALPGATRYHLPHCQLISDRLGTAQPVARADQEAAGRRPCGVCLP
jgi:hypothetical protein